MNFSFCYRCIFFLLQSFLLNIVFSITTCISLPIWTNVKPLATIGKFPNAIDKLMIVKTLTTNLEEITNTMIGNDILAIYWQSLVNWLCKHWIRMVTVGRTLVQQITIISCYNNNITNIIKRMSKWLTNGNDNNKKIALINRW